MVYEILLDPPGGLGMSRMGANELNTESFAELGYAPLVYEVWSGGEI